MVFLNACKTLTHRLKQLFKVQLYRHSHIPSWSKRWMRLVLLGYRRVLRASTSHSTENMSQMSAFPLKDCSCLPNSLCVWETPPPPGLLFRNIAFCGMWREEFTNSLLRRKNVDFLFPFSAVNSNSNHTSSKLSKAMILLVKPLVSWLWLFCF